MLDCIIQNNICEDFELFFPPALRLKEAQQEKRRALDTRLKEQKKKKLDLSSAKLSDDILQGISEVDSQPQTG